MGREFNSLPAEDVITEMKKFLLLYENKKLPVRVVVQTERLFYITGIGR